MKQTAALAFALLLATSARAADESTLYLYGAAGAVRTHPGIVQADADAQVAAAVIAAGGTADVTSTVNNNDTGFKVQVGWMFSKHFAFEVGYVGLGSSRYSATFTDGTAQSDFKAGGILFDLVGFAPLGGDVSAYAKAGVIAATVVTSFTMNVLTVNGPVSTHTTGSDSMLKPNFGVGLSYDISRNVALRFEVERYSHLGSDATGGKSNMDMASVGVVLKL